MDIQQMLAQSGMGQQGMTGPAGMGQQGSQQHMMPFLIMLLQTLLGQSGGMPQPAPQTGQMPFASALGAQGGGMPGMPQMPPGL